MQTTRRDVLSFASVGAAGAAGLALGAFSRSTSAAGNGGSTGGKGPGIEGPLLDRRLHKGGFLKITAHQRPRVGVTIRQR